MGKSFVAKAKEEFQGAGARRVSVAVAKKHRKSDTR